MKFDQKSKSIACQVDGNTLIFKVDKPQMLVVDINEEKPLLLALLPIDHSNSGKG
jgi:hypothetical protein